MSLSEELPGTWELISRIGMAASGERRRAMTVEGDALTIRLQTTSVQGETVTRTLKWKRVG